MANFNKVILAGNLTRDPQLSYLPSSTPVCEFGLAINRKWKGQDGQMREEACFVDARIFGKPAETFNQYMSKGQPVLIEGRLRYETWEGKDGNRKSRLSVVVDTFQFLGGPNRTGQGGARSAPPPQRAAYSAPAAGGYAPPAPAYDQLAGGMDEMPPVEEAPSGDEIPF